MSFITNIMPERAVATTASADRPLAARLTEVL